jgi:hypothetical protein
LINVKINQKCLRGLWQSQFFVHVSDLKLNLLLLASGMGRDISKLHFLDFQFEIICLFSGRSMSRTCNVIPCPGNVIHMTTNIDNYF